MQSNVISKKFIAGLIVVVLVLAALYTIIRSPEQQNKDAGKEASGKSAAAQSGSFTLDYDTDKNKQGIFRVGQPIEIRLLADTNGKNITDYDAYIQFNQNSLTVRSSASLVKDYSVAHTVGDSIVAVTGYKSIKGSSQKFDGGPLFSLTFIPSEAGTYEFTILPKTRIATTKFIDTEARQFTPATGTLRIDVLPR